MTLTALGKDGRSRRARRLAVGAALVVVATSTALALVPDARATATALLPGAGSEAAPTKGATEAAPVRGLRVQVVRLVRPVEERSYTGTVVARFETPLAFRIPGKIQTRAVEVGNRVRAGDVLMELDPADYDEAVTAAEAALASAHAQAAQTQAEDVRQEALLAEGWVSRAAYDRVQAAVEAVRAAEAKLELALNSQAYVRLVAAEDGIVTAVSAEADQFVNAGQPVATVSGRTRSRRNSESPKARSAAWRTGRPRPSSGGSRDGRSPRAFARSRPRPIRSDEPSACASHSGSERIWAPPSRSGSGARARPPGRASGHGPRVPGGPARGLGRRAFRGSRRTRARHVGAARGRDGPAARPARGGSGRDAGRPSPGRGPAHPRRGDGRSGG